MIIVKFLATIALLSSIIWIVVDFGFESGLALVGSLSALVSAFHIDKRNARRPQQHQSVSQSSTGIQAGGNVSIGNVEGKKHAK